MEKVEFSKWTPCVPGSGVWYRTNGEVIKLRCNQGNDVITIQRRDAEALGLGSVLETCKWPQIIPNTRQTPDESRQNPRFPSNTGEKRHYKAYELSQKILKLQTELSKLLT